ncbi:MAG: hypothetical protein ACOCYT_03960 [Chloroflexota bacterium]
MIPDRAGNAEQWEVDILTVILLRQFKRLLAQRGVDLTDAQMQAHGAAVAAHQPDAVSVCTALDDIVRESVDRLGEWDLTFARALAADMTDMNHLWETTAEFLDVANEKVNAEVRISAGSSLMVLLGDCRNAVYLIEAIEHDLGTYGSLDVDAVIARRALLHTARIDADDADWLRKVRDWISRLDGADCNAGAS